MLRRALLSALVAATAATPAFAQRLTVRAFTSEDGLPEDRVKCIERDTRGILWFCTTAGVAWFDGRRFNAYGTQDGLPNPSINDIAEDPQGGYWIATNGGGLARLDHTPPRVARWPPDADTRVPRMTVVRVGATPRSNRVNTVHVDREGRLWAGTDAGLFLRGDDGAFEEVPLPIPRRAPHVLVWRFSESPDGTLWMATTQGLVSRAPDGSIARHPVQPDASADHVRTVLHDGASGVWIGHDTGLYRARRPPSATAGGAIAALELEHVALKDVKGVPISMLRTREGAIWIGFSRGSLVRYDGHDFETLTEAEGLPPDIRAIGADAEDRLWAGGPTGATRIHTGGPKWFDLPPAFEGSAVTDLVETPDGTIAAITAGSEIDIHWPDGARLHSVRPRLPPGRVREARRGTSLIDRTGAWWFGTRRGLLRFDPVTHVRRLDGARPSRIYDTADGLPGEEVRHLFEDSRGTIWITAATPEGYATARLDDARRRFESVDGLPPERQVSSVVEDRGGNVWLAFRDGGVARWRRGRVEMFEPEGGMLADWVAPMYCDRQGRLWLASGGRIVRVVNPDDESPRFEIHSAETRAVAGNHFFAEDEGGVLSIDGAGGVNRLMPHPAQVLPGPDAEGLRGLTVARMDRAGLLWLATRRGLARVDLSQPQARPAARVFVHHLTIGGREYPLAVGGQRDVAEIAVPLHAGPIDIQYWSPAADLRFQHRLVGADAAWREGAPEHTVSLAHMSAGRYRFDVRAVDATGTPLSDVASVRLYVVPPLWQRGWVLASSAALAAVIAWVAHRRRIARAIEVERLRTRIATDLHDDIGSNLSRIAILSELAQRRERAGPGNSRDVLATIGQSARELVDSMGDIVWAIRPEADGAADLAHRMRRFASDVLAPCGIALRFEAPDADRHVMLPPDVRREVFLVFKEAIHNVLKHASATEVDVTLRIAGEIALTVSDNGRGFAGEDAGATRGYGMKTLRERAARIDGVLEVVSLSEHGTSVRLRAPMPARAHLFG